MISFAGSVPRGPVFIVPLKCYVCGDIYGSTESAYAWHSSGVCRKSECEKRHSEAMKSARESARRKR